MIQIEGMAAAGYSDAQITYVGMGADVIEDASVKTGGADAKDPMGTGLIINIITRSGGNDLSMSASYDHQEYDWGTGNEEGLGGFLGDNELPNGFDPFASEKANFAAMGVFDPPDEVVAGFGTPTAHQVHQADFTLGGPIMRDKAWFFATYRWADLAARISRSALDVGFLRGLSGISLASGLGSAPTYSEFPNTTKSHQPYLKLTTQLNANHELSAYFQRDQLNNTSNREYDLAPRYIVKTGWRPVRRQADFGLRHQHHRAVPHFLEQQGSGSGSHGAAAVRLGCALCGDSQRFHRELQRHDRRRRPYCGAGNG